jgi:hypothetical protein
LLVLVKHVALVPLARLRVGSILHCVDQACLLDLDLALMSCALARQ